MSTQQQDPTEDIRRQMIGSGQLTGELQAHLERGGEFWDSAGLRRNFEVIGFMAPLVAVRRRSDGVKGSLKFVHSPRYYFDFQEDQA